MSCPKSFIYKDRVAFFLFNITFVILRTVNYKLKLLLLLPLPTANRCRAFQFYTSALI